MQTHTKFLLIRIAGMVSGLFFLFHIGFYWLFNWSQSLLSLNSGDRAIMLTFNLVVILFLLYSAILSLGHTRELIKTTVGKSVLIFFAAFYIARILCEFLYFGFRFLESVVVISICLIPAVCFALPVFFQSKAKK
jgi:hypothetical protein